MKQRAHECGPGCAHVRVDAPADWDEMQIAQAVVGGHVLLKAESAPFDVWYRDRPMKELNVSFIAAYRALLKRMIAAIQKYVEHEVAHGPLGKADRVPVLITPQQLDAIRRIIGDYHAAFVVGGIDPEALSPAEVQRLMDAGVVSGDLAFVFHPSGPHEKPPEAMHAIDDAWRYGYQLGMVDHPAQKRPIEGQSYQDWRRGAPQPELTQAEQASLQWARTKAAQHVQGLGNVVASDFSTIAIEADAQLRRQAEEIIREEVSENVQKREAWRQIVTALGDRTDDWARDLGRIAATEKHDAIQQGQARAMKRKRGRGSGDVRVSKQPNPDACKHCIRLYTDGGKPKIFWLSELEKNGTNVGRKAADWLPVVGPVHPWCFPAGTLVATEFGDLPIEEVTVGTLVRTHVGRLRAVHRLSKRAHRGELVVITAGGDLLETTPEHPLLTQRGWVRAGAVKLGDQLFRTPHSAIPVQQSENPESCDGGERVFCAVLRALARRGVPVGIDLDQQAVIGKPDVEAVRAYRELWHATVTALFQEIEDSALVGGQRAAAFAGLRRMNLLCDRPGEAAARAVSSLREALSLFRAALRCDDVELLAIGADGDACAEQPMRDRAPRGLVRFRELVHTLAGLVTNDDLGIRQDDAIHSDVHYHAAPVTSSHRRAFDAEVFNFAVEEDESYVAAGFVVHNCACELIEVPEGWDFDDEGNLVPEALRRSELLEGALRKSEASLAKRPMLFGAAGGDGSVTVRIGDPLIREAAEEVIARTPPAIFTRATGVTMVTTDHPRETNMLDDGDLAYWTGNEIRIAQAIEPSRVRRVLEHEIGHALNAWLRTKFGDVAKVREWHAQLWEVSKREGFVTSYAKREPIENAAEVTRLFIYRRALLLRDFPLQYAMCKRAYGDLLPRR